MIKAFTIDRLNPKISVEQNQPFSTVKILKAVCNTHIEKSRFMSLKFILSHEEKSLHIGIPFIKETHDFPSRDILSMQQFLEIKKERHYTRLVIEPNNLILKNNTIIDIELDIC